jgi:hypothetical protein
MLRQFGLLLVLACILTGCSFFEQPDAGLAEQSGQHAIVAIPEDNVVELSNGHTYRKKSIYLDTGELRDVLHIVNIGTDPTIGIGYNPDQPQILSDWHKSIEGRILFNGGYFNAEYHSTSYLKGDGVTEGPLSKTGANGYTGALLQKKDGSFELRYLPENPIEEVEVPELMLFSQSFPTLILPGGRAGLDQITQRKARRTVIARNTAGEILLLFTERSSFSLSEFMNYLLESSLEIDLAINLDGGASTGLLIDDEHMQFELPSSILPIVFAVQ